MSPELRAPICQHGCAFLKTSLITPSDIRVKRRQYGVKQKQLANALGCSVRYLREIEHGETYLTVPLQAAILTFFASLHPFRNVS
jgi:DNA-binding transcriptional regulator YiaG